MEAGGGSPLRPVHGGCLCPGEVVNGTVDVQLPGVSRGPCVGTPKQGLGLPSVSSVPGISLGIW